MFVCLDDFTPGLHTKDYEMLNFLYLYLFLVIAVHCVTLSSISSRESYTVKVAVNDSEKRMTKTDAVYPNICKSDICVEESTQIMNSLNVRIMNSFV